MFKEGRVVNGVLTPDQDELEQDIVGFIQDRIPDDPAAVLSILCSTFARSVYTIALPGKAAAIYDEITRFYGNKIKAAMINKGELVNDGSLDTSFLEETDSGSVQ